MAPSSARTIERRRNVRARVSGVAAVGYLDRPDLVAATTENISVTGMCLRGRLAAVPGDDVVVVVKIGDGEVSLLTTVVRSECVGDQEVELHLEMRWCPEQWRAELARLTSEEPAR